LNHEHEKGGAELKDVASSKNKFVKLGSREKVKIPYYKGIYSRRKDIHVETAQPLVESNKLNIIHSPKHFKKKIAQINRNIIGLK